MTNDAGRFYYLQLALCSLHELDEKRKAPADFLMFQADSIWVLNVIQSEKTEELL